MTEQQYEEEMIEEDGHMSIIDHLTELRNRIGIVFFVFCRDVLHICPTSFW